MKSMSESKFLEMTNSIWLEYLEQASASDLHGTACTKNYGDIYAGGNGEWIFQWIVDSPTTERATALLMYWMLGPRAVTRSFPLLDKLEHKLLANGFTVGDIGLDPANDHEEYDWTNEYTDMKKQRTIDSRLLQPVVGSTYSRSDFEDGLPLHYAQKIEKILDEHEIK